jgi:arylformamidase
MTLIDISPLIDATINVWPGDTPFVRTVNTDMHAGANLTLSDVRTTLHVGAHADAPSHYITDGPDIARGERILPDHVADKVDALSAPRVLFHTGTFPDHSHWNNDFASLSPELVDDLYHHGVRLIGIDTPSVDLFDSKSLEAHHAFARNNMAMLEGLMLEGVEEGEYELIALPLRIRCADASPVRAVLRTL